MKRRLRNKFNISLAEESSNKWQICELYTACINLSRQGAEGELSRIEEFIRLQPYLRIKDTEKEIF